MYVCGVLKLFITPEFGLTCAPAKIIVGASEEIFVPNGTVIAIVWLVSLIVPVTAGESELKLKTREFEMKKTWICNENTWNWNENKKREFKIKIREIEMKKCEFEMIDVQIELQRSIKFKWFFYHRLVECSRPKPFDFVIIDICT